MDRIRVDALVLGAGVVGLACAADLARSGREVTVLEAEESFGRHASSRNSEVLHAGFYYPENSLKSRHCLNGRLRLIERATSRGLPLRLCGKVVVAQDESEEAKLEALLERGRRVGVPGLEMLSASALADLEPALRARSALHSPESGIVDSHALMQDLVDEIESAGGQIVYRSRVRRLQPTPGATEFEIEGAENELVEARLFVNAAGASAFELARDFDLGLHAGSRLRLVRGHYLDYAGPSPFRRLVYPVPERDGLGIHATLDLAGRLRFGPDTLEVNTLDYALPADLASAFATSIRRYWPEVDETRLKGGYAGVRTKLLVDDEAPPDFAILGPEDHGHDGVVHLLGIESPGLTAALSIADEVTKKLLSAT